MTTRILLTIFAAIMCAPALANPQGLVTKASKHSVAEAVDKLDTVLSGAGMTIFARIDHAAAAEKAGLKMPPAVVIVFGNPKGGTPMMRGAPTIAIDLPMKILVWEDASGKAWVSYNTGRYVADRHELKGMDKQIQGLDGALAKLTASVIE